MRSILFLLIVAGCTTESVSPQAHATVVGQFAECEGSLKKAHLEVGTLLGEVAEAFGRSQALAAYAVWAAVQPAGTKPDKLFVCTEFAIDDSGELVTLVLTPAEYNTPVVVDGLESARCSSEPVELVFRYSAEGKLTAIE